MQKHLSQAQHNQNFVKDCSASHPDTYFDWKITASFYTALHLLRAFCVKRGVDPGDTHESIDRSFNPRRCKGYPITQFPKHLWECYSNLRRYSEDARYNGILDPEVENELLRDDLIDVRAKLSKLMFYFSNNGVDCGFTEAAGGENREEYFDKSSFKDTSSTEGPEII